MGYETQLLPTAERDLLDIAAYLTQFYERTYPNFITEFDRSVENLENLPYIGVSYKDYRRLVVDDYLVFYQVNEESRIVQIYRVLHGSQDIQSRLTD